jgi:hypothetical protein
LRSSGSSAAPTSLRTRLRACSCRERRERATHCDASGAAPRLLRDRLWACRPADSPLSTRCVIAAPALGTCAAGTGYTGRAHSRQGPSSAAARLVIERPSRAAASCQTSGRAIRRKNRSCARGRGTKVSERAHSVHRLPRACRAGASRTASPGAQPAPRVQSHACRKGKSAIVVRGSGAPSADSSGLQHPAERQAASAERSCSASPAGSMAKPRDDIILGLLTLATQIIVKKKMRRSPRLGQVGLVV